MISIVSGPVTIQTSAQSVPCTPGWMGEVTLIAHHLRKLGVLSAIAEQVRFARRRFGRYEVLDFIAVLLGYAISGERTLEADLTTGLLPGQIRSWRCSGVSGCPRVRRSRAFWLRSPRSLSRPCARSFSRMGFLALWTKRSKRLGYGIDKQPAGSFSTWMARERRPVNEPCQRVRIGPHPSAACAACVLLATPAASEGKSCAHAPRSCRCTRISGWPALAIPATDNTERTCAAP
jgi:hypothetical protein